jgi:uncharacterized lipoprotein NlpE involved in copper resistance
MKNLIFALSIVLLLGGCDDKGMNNEQETGPFSLIGTWEASGEYVVEGDQRTYKSTLVFTETEYTQESHYKSKQGTFNFLDKREGTYVSDENNITYTDYDISGSTKVGPYIMPISYKFINKNTLETFGPGITGSSAYIQSVSFKRK